MKKYLFILSAFALFVTVQSCKKKCKEAGTGGKLTIAATPQHHGQTIWNRASYLDTVYVKFNTKDAPGNGAYDTYFVGEDGENHVHLKNLKCGDYYLFAAGWDTTISKRVTGGIPFSTDKEDGEVDLNIPVTE